VILQIQTSAVQGLGPDAVHLGFEDPAGAFHVLAEIDGRYLSTEVACGFIGRVIGPYAIATTAAFDWFDYEDLEQST
jgi:hypothetical protein